jgi:hypothetical protein
LRSGAWLVGAAALAAAACDGKTMSMGAHTPFAGCTSTPAAPPTELGLDPFYAKYLDGYGTPVVSSDKVSDQALVQACRITGNLVSLREDIRQALDSKHHHVAVLAQGEKTTDIPEYADLYQDFPNTDWNAIRSLGATRQRPVTSDGEENLRCLPGDIYPGLSALVGMLAQSVRILAIAEIDSTFTGKIRAAYDSAMSQNLWANTTATNSAEDYWALGSSAWLGASTKLPVNSHAALSTYDPPLAALLAQYLPSNDWRSTCYGP